MGFPILFFKVLVLVAVSLATLPTYVPSIEKRFNQIVQRMDQAVDSSLVSDDPCVPLPKPKFNTFGNRLSDKKCLEYAWEFKHRKENAKRHLECVKRYLLSEDTEVKMKPLNLDETPLDPYDDEHPVFYETDKSKYLKYLEESLELTLKDTQAYAHMAAVGWLSVSHKWEFNCGGSIISPNFVLTAAHCSKFITTELAYPEPRIVRVGDYVIRETEETIAEEGRDRVRKRLRGYYNPVNDIDTGRLDVFIKRFITHPNYKPPLKYYDIGLIELERSLIFNKDVQPSCLWLNPDITSIPEVVVTGWGVTENGTTSPYLIYAELDLVKPKDCWQYLRHKKHRHWKQLKDHQLCAGKVNKEVDTCQGDSGGPLEVPLHLDYMEKEEYMQYILGVTSFGFGCGQNYTPGLYTRVSSFVGWVEDVVWAPIDLRN